MILPRNSHRQCHAACTAVIPSVDVHSLIGRLNGILKQMKVSAKISYFLVGEIYVLPQWNHRRCALVNLFSERPPPRTSSRNLIIR